MLAETDNLLNLLTAATEDRGKIQQACERLVTAAAHASPQDRSEAVRRLSPVILNEDLKRAGMSAALCGMLVESGADPAAMGEPLLVRLLPALRAGDVDVVDAFASPAIALFCAKPSLRAANREVRDLAESFSNRIAWCAWLPTIFDVLEDEPLLVIEPSTHTGILARLSGADVNFTLEHAADASLPGRHRPTPFASFAQSRKRRRRRTAGFRRMGARSVEPVQLGSARRERIVARRPEEQPALDLERRCTLRHFHLCRAARRIARAGGLRPLLARATNLRGHAAQLAYRKTSNPRRSTKLAA